MDNIAGKVVPFFLVLGLILTETAPFSINAETAVDFRFISFKDLLQSSERFTDENITTFSRLLFDISRNQVIVGARDVLYRMSLNLNVIERSTWEPNNSMEKICQDKGQRNKDCRNFIMVLQNHGDQLYACGTYAFSPICSWRQMENLTAIRYDNGVAKCPFSPYANMTTHMTETGQMFVGTTTDFSGSDAAILRYDALLEANGSRMLRSDQYNSKWLNNPQFVGSFEAGNFVYFVFREVAVEYINCGKIVYSRIARVCKSDSGGERILRDNWTSFLKARLNCSIPGEFPFYFNEIQGIVYSSDENILYATFTTPSNSIYGSAVCAFNLSAINGAFSGPFKYQDTDMSTWQSADSIHRSHYECKTNYKSTSARHNQLLDSSRYQLMDKAVQPTKSYPLHVSKLERFVHITLDTVSTKMYEPVHVLYVCNDEGLVKKLSILPRTKETCLIEAWQLGRSDKIHTLQYLKNTESLYVGTEKSLIKIPAQHCNRHASKESCLNAMDPYCGWNELQESCTPPPNRDALVKYWIQNSTECPILTAPVDGSWSAWSDWFRCSHYGSENDDTNSNMDACLCRIRHCDNPKPKNGGKPCVGMSVAVTNCTVNGGWTEWSAWSACSQSCGVAVKTRRRTCGNPKPAHGGRVCVGADRAEWYCSHLPPCPVPKFPPIDGSWGPWGPWSECTTKCGGGFRFRRRKCNSPEPSNGGLECSGCNIEYERCNTNACAEVRKLSTWTPWLLQHNGSTSDGGHLETRFRYSCKTDTITDSNSLRITLAKEESRVCYDNGSCQRTDESETEWSAWSPCSVSCGGGQQFRKRFCGRKDCEKKARACNTHSCPEWSCWSDWSPCSVSCGVGVKKRTRRCLSESNDCTGRSVEEQLCEMQPCESFAGWGPWSEWTSCVGQVEQSRFRKCLILSPSPTECQGDDQQTKICDFETSNEMVLTSGINSVLFVITIICVSMIILFILLILFYLYFKKKHLRRPNNTVSLQQSFENHYSSLPTSDNFNIVKPKLKRQKSVNTDGNHSGRSISNDHSTLTKSNNMSGPHTPKVLSKSFTGVENSPLKRHSQGLNNHMTRRIDDEKF